MAVTQGNYSAHCKSQQSMSADFLQVVQSNISRLPDVNRICAMLNGALTRCLHVC